MRTLRWSELDDRSRLALIERAATSRAMFAPQLREQIAGLVDDVEVRGDQAVVDALKNFDGVDVLPERLLLSADAIEQGASSVSPEVVSAIEVAIERSKEFNSSLLPASSWRRELKPGLVVGEKITPIESAGLFVPSGKGSFPSVLVQIGTPATVAGVERRLVIVPPDPATGAPDPAVLEVARQLGITEVLCANGPAGVAAAALGTESIDPVLKIVGPGSPPVSAAMLECQRRGCVTQMVLGPSESAIVADSSADIDLLAADFLNEAEHGPDTSAFLILWDEALVEPLSERVMARLAQLPEQRAEWATTAITENGGVVIVSDAEEAAALVNSIAPEHAQLAVEDPEALLELITNAGEVLLGQGASFSLANYTVGVPASLPTGRFARVSSGITAETFLKRTSVAKVSPEANEALTDAALALAEHEDFPAHAAALRARRDA
jgi:histidinol dehydrogenase